MAVSQNGWTVLDDPPPITVLIPDILNLRVRPGPVSIIFSHLANVFHTTIERVDLRVEEDPGFDDWGWAKRPVRGSTTVYSNHASGTAIDLNATRHPRGVDNTFSPAQVANIRKMLTFYEGVIRWGGDYSTTVDEMHFEIRGELADVLRIAGKILDAEAAEEEMQVSDLVDLGPSQSKTLSQPDNKAEVGELLAAAATGAVISSNNSVQIINAINKQNGLLTEIRDLLASQRPNSNPVRDV